MGYEAFQKLCEENNVRPGTVARATGIATATLTSWKKGRYTPKTDKLMKIADYFNVSVDVFYEKHDQGENSGQQKYYNDDRTAEIAQKIFDSKELSLLFDAAVDASPDDLQTAYDILLALKRKEQHDD